MKTLKTLLLTSLFVAPVAFASSLPINPTFNSQTNYVWEDSSERRGGGR
ncbi:hypothetical protein AB4152_15190 [Vibrio breoganii]|nr:hypothetical protein [Vibrio breoganii]